MKNRGVLLYQAAKKLGQDVFELNYLTWHCDYCTWAHVNAETIHSAALQVFFFQEGTSECFFRNMTSENLKTITFLSIEQLQLLKQSHHPWPGINRSISTTRTNYHETDITKKTVCWWRPFDMVESSNPASSIDSVSTGVRSKMQKLKVSVNFAD